MSKYKKGPPCGVLNAPQQKMALSAVSSEAGMRRDSSASSRTAPDSSPASTKRRPPFRFIAPPRDS